ncbi:hypothetical protein [Streptomyces sp. NPDC002402]
MTRRLTVAERLASADKDIRLHTIALESSWDQFLVEQAVLHFGSIYLEWSCNSLRSVLPKMGHGFLGAAINSLRTGGVIEHTGRVVPSTLPSTNGHRIAVWTLTDKGRAIAAERRAARRDKGDGRAAA